METINKELQFSKTVNPCAYAQVEKMRSFDNFECDESSSQIMKRLDKQEASEIIELLSEGKKVVLA